MKLLKEIEIKILRGLGFIKAVYELWRDPMFNEEFKFSDYDKRRK